MAVGRDTMSGTALLHDARWEIVWKHCRLPSLEQVSRLAADLREAARQAHEDDRENRMMAWTNWLRTNYKAACKWCKGVDSERTSSLCSAKMADIQPTLRTCTRSLRKLGFRASRCTNWVRSQLGSSMSEHIPATCECIVIEKMFEKHEHTKCTRSGRVEGCGIASTPLQLCENLAHVLKLVNGDMHVACTTHTRFDIAHSQGRRIGASSVSVQTVGFDEDS